MKSKLLVALALNVILGARAFGAPQTSVTQEMDDNKRITIRLYKYAEVEPAVLINAERTTGDILREAGVMVVWIECPIAHLPEEKPGCKAPLPPTDVELNLLSRSMSRRLHLGGHVFGVALEDPQGDFGSHGWIFCDPLKDAAAQSGVNESLLLGAVMAHELGHLLLSTNSHSTSGLMRANWSSEELLAIRQKALHFSSGETRRIQKAVMARHQSLFTTP